MENDIYEIVVIGAGLIGSAAAKYAAEDFPNGQTLLVGPGAGLNTLEHGKENNRLNGAWHDEGRIADCLAEDDLWNTLAEESIKRYGNIESESKISFFDPVGFLSVWRHSNISSEYLEEIEDRAAETECIEIDDNYSLTHFPYLRFSDHDYLAYHQPPSSRLAGIINPRRLIKAQTTIAGSKFGCHLMDGQVEKVTRLEINKEDSVTPNSLFQMEIKKYQTCHVNNHTLDCTVRAKRVILATGVYTNMIPKLQNVLSTEKECMEPELDLPCQTVAFLQVNEDIVRNKMKMMPTLNINYDFGIVDGAYILPPIKYPDGNYYLKLGHYNQFETNLKGDMETITKWYKQGHGVPDAVRLLSDFVIKDLIKDPSISFNNITSDCCVTVNTPGKLAPYIDDFSPGVTLVTGGCGNGAMCSDEIGRLGAKLATTGYWDSRKISRKKTRIQWRKIEGQQSDVLQE